MRLIVVGLFLLVGCSGNAFSSDESTEGGNANEQTDGGTAAGVGETGGADSGGASGSAAGGQAGSSEGGAPSTGGTISSAGNSADVGAGDAGDPSVGGAAGAAGIGGTAGEGQAGESGQADAGTPQCPSPTTYYLDHDGDGYGSDITTDACEPPQAVVPLVDDDLSTGVWVTQSGDCYDGRSGVHPGAITVTTVSFPGQYGPSYDSNCNGLEEPVEDTEWVSPQENCTLTAPYQCSGGGAEVSGNRSATDPGANDLCGGQKHGCLSNTSAGPCVFDYQGKNGCK